MRASGESTTECRVRDFGGVAKIVSRWAHSRVEPPRKVVESLGELGSMEAAMTRISDGSLDEKV
jgi:hypothetical protein